MSFDFFVLFSVVRIGDKKQEGGWGRAAFSRSLLTRDKGGLRITLKDRKRAGLRAVDGAGKHVYSAAKERESW